ncbi:S54 family peptidase (macronuclear) [Tetrahymena thermophila SB210]|uniref:S54 family peptidase n=1 Tax=Tetrahymena thermophila (strain SB210) TaxID=312017 RepID=Q22WI6_TETTS|nr:S54 family peptidase [Tetrahymena thermophila SB210]EAR89431.2 S54 family peptidase [Tetrahymena thermophila SB210]|eukprot:XP_001009676.2 S54 family peptidase [Tetrahymena thermophila SB210]
MFQFKNKFLNSVTSVFKGRKLLQSNQPSNFFQGMKPQFNYNRVNQFFYRMNNPVTYSLLGANLLVFGLYQFRVIKPSTFIDNFTLGQKQINQHRYHTLATYSFAHTNLMHLGANMIGLYFFGKFIENQFGSRALAKLYFGGALLGGIFILLDLYKKRSNQIHIGASASISAIVTNFTLNFPRLTVYFFFIPMPAWVLGILILLQSVVFYGDNGSVSHQGHLGGIVFGGLSYFLMKKGRF